MSSALSSIGSIFKGRTPSPTPLPAAATDPNLIAQQQMDASRAAQAARNGAGRQSTIVAGATINDNQDGIGLLGGPRKRFGASQDLGT